MGPVVTNVVIAVVMVGVDLIAALLVAYAVLCAVRTVRRRIRYWRAFRRITPQRIDTDLTAHESEFDHLSDEYMRKLNDAYLMPGDDY